MVKVKLEKSQIRYLLQVGSTELVDKLGLSVGGEVEEKGNSGVTSRAVGRLREQHV